jgi:hypothetical protein
MAGQWISTTGGGQMTAIITIDEPRPVGRFSASAPTGGVGLALQLPFCFEVRTLCDCLVSSAPE